jgi:hypothetical protein
VLSSSMQRPLLCVKQLVVKRFYHDRGLCVSVSQTASRIMWASLSPANLGGEYCMMVNTSDVLASQ